jgi:hypothetical protein
MRYLSGLWWLEESIIRRLRRLTQIVQIMRWGLSVGIGALRFNPARSGTEVFLLPQAGRLFFVKKKFFLS